MKPKYSLTVFAILLLTSCDEIHKRHMGGGVQKDSANAVSNKTITNRFEKKVTYKNIGFTVFSEQLDGGNNFSLIPSGFSVANDTIHQQVDGKLADLVVGDIDGDDRPEAAVIIYAGESKRGSVYLYSSNRDKSLSPVAMPELKSDDPVLKGYYGYDEFEFVEGTFIRRFPLYENSKPSGKFRQIQYKLKAGEAMKKMVKQRTVEY